MISTISPNPDQRTLYDTVLSLTELPLSEVEQLDGMVRCKVTLMGVLELWLTLKESDDGSVVATLHDLIAATLPPNSASARVMKMHSQSEATEDSIPTLFQLMAMDVDSALRASRTVGDLMHLVAIASNCNSVDSFAGLDPSDGEVFVRAKIPAHDFGEASIQETIGKLLQHAIQIVSFAELVNSVVSPRTEPYVPGGVVQPPESDQESTPTPQSESPKIWL